MSDGDQASAELQYYGPLRTMNAERSGGRWDHRKHTREAREVAGWRALRLPRFKWARIEVFPSQARGVLADAGSHAPTAKALVDGLVDAGVLVDDSPKFVPQITFHAPERGKVGMRLLLVGELAKE